MLIFCNNQISQSNISSKKQKVTLWYLLAKYVKHTCITFLILFFITCEKQQVLKFWWLMISTLLKVWTSLNILKTGQTIFICYHCVIFLKVLLFEKYLVHKSEVQFCKWKKKMFLLKLRPVFYKKKIEWSSQFNI